MIEGYEFDLQPYCSGCTWFYPEAKYATDNKDKTVWSVRCRNRGQCIRLVRQLQREVTKDETKDES